MLRASGIVCSMSRPGGCWDNAVAESFFCTLKSDLSLNDPGLTPELARAQVSDYIDHFYNPQRRHSTLDYFSPIEYDLKHFVDQQSTKPTCLRKSGKLKRFDESGPIHS